MKPLEYWRPEGFEISSYKYSLKERVNQTYTTSGSDNTGQCTYTYNELGFRGDSINKKGFKVMSLGCSITEGVGVNDNETWPSQFSKLIDNGVNMNFGTGGRSNDFICRCLLSYFDLIKPDLVLIMYTFPHRREVYTKENFIEPYIPTKVWGRLAETKEGNEIQKSLDSLQNDNEDFINWYKNHLLIKNFLENKKCNWIWNGQFAVSKDFIESNRFDGLKPFLDLGADAAHPGNLTHKTYAYKLHRFISERFPNYLPNDSYQKNTNLI